MPSCRSNSNVSLSRLVLSATVFALAVGCSEPQFSLPTSPTDTDSTSTTTTTTRPRRRTHRHSAARWPCVDSVSIHSPCRQREQSRVTLEQLQNGAGTASAATLVLGLGVPSGTGCAMLREVAAGASDAPHIDESLTAGIYCTQLTDPGTLTEAAEAFAKADSSFGISRGPVAFNRSARVSN